ncbi:DUF2782 domain-containing protein [Paraherbaspirillum soli]|uniref:DUF2782 domain-containing protein n=1 Tax=Paraherbaspirillum soli TaxID=631222 RepID=A0ABW0ME98_9BURK
MNKSKVWQLIAAGLASIATPLLVHAQPAAGNAAPPPPELEKLEEGVAPATTPRKPGEAKPKITEKREQGRVTEVKVETGGSTYYLKPQQVGNSVPGDTPSAPARGAQWQIKEFDLGRKLHKPGEEIPTEGTAPAPPTVTPAK